MTVLVLAPFAVDKADAVAVSLLVLFQAVVWIAPLGLLALARRAATDVDGVPVSPEEGAPVAD